MANLAGQNHSQVKFLGKMEDDSVLYDTRVLAELIAFHRSMRREGKRESARARDALVWYGHFDWAMHHIGDMANAKFCGVGDYSMLAHAPACGRGNGVLAPFANGGLDIRSRSLAEQAATCELVWEYVRGFDANNASYGGSCDGLQVLRVGGDLFCPAGRSAAAAAAPELPALHVSLPLVETASRVCGRS